MQIVQVEKGVSVIKIVADVLLKADYDTHAAALRVWSDAYATSSTDEDGNNIVITAADAPPPPAYPTPTEYKSGEITLTWEDDTFV
jgi:hypothetical protein